MIPLQPKARVAVLAACLAAGCAHGPGPAPSPAASYVESDAVWSGEVRVAGVVHVRKGATLSIAPGTRVLFAPLRLEPTEEHEGFSGSGIRVDGRIVALGTEDAPILFVPAEAPSAPGSWDKILFAFSAGNRFTHCVFAGARYAIHAHFSEIAIDHCIFRGNEEGVRLGASRVVIENSVFSGNEIRGINFRECRNEIRRNLVYGNGDGVFLHSKNAASVLKDNAIYGNRNFNLRLGDLHADDFDASRNWWGTSREEEAAAAVHDGRSLAGLGRVTLAPVLARPPVAGAAIRGVFLVHMMPVAGADVRAYASIGAGLWTEDFVAEATTDGEGLFTLSVPPGRYHVIGRAASKAGTLFAYPGRNPVPVDFGGSAEIALPSVLSPPEAVSAEGPGRRASIAARATLDGRPLAGVTVQASVPSSPDFRGPGIASAVTDDLGVATLHLPPGRYLLAAKKRSSGAAMGMVEEGGLFGVYPGSPVDLGRGQVLSVEIPLFEKAGLVGRVEERARVEEGTRAAEGVPEGAREGKALLGGRPAAGHIVFFYRAPETIGRPAARSSVVSPDGRFAAPPLPAGDYLAYLRKAVPGLPGGAEEERIGPVPLRVEGERLLPPSLSFPAK